MLRAPSISSSTPCKPTATKLIKPPCFSNVRRPFFSVSYQTSARATVARRRVSTSSQECLIHVAIIEPLLALRRVVAVCDHHVLIRLHAPHCTSPFITFVARLSDRTRMIGLSELHTYGSHTTICTSVSSLSVWVKPNEIVHWNFPTFSSCRGESSWLQQSLARRTHAA